MTVTMPPKAALGSPDDGDFPAAMELATSIDPLLRDQLPPTQIAATPRCTASGDQTSEVDQCRSDDQSRIVGLGSNLPDGQYSPDAQRWSAVGDQATRVDQEHVDAQTLPVDSGSTSPSGQGLLDAQRISAARGPILADPLLGIAADILDDLENVRVANENRLRALTTAPDVEDADGICRGHGLTLDHPDVAKVAALVEALKAAEHQAVLNLQRAMRNHPLGPWIKEQPGVGFKQAARLLAVIRDPYWNDLHDRPRTVSELWAYCGFHVLGASQVSCDTQGRTAGTTNSHPDGQQVGDAHGRRAVGVAPKRQRGQRSNWNEDARKRAWLIAASCVKQPADTKWRKVYDDTRTKYADAVHAAECVRCGPAGKPAQPGSPLSLGHQHARGLRAIAKGLLKELWRESKRLHELEGKDA